MAVMLKVVATGGEERTLYVRLNNAEPSNHGVVCSALFRGFASKEIFDQRADPRFIGTTLYLWEKYITFNADVAKPLWEQAYAAFKIEFPFGVDA